MSVSLWASVVLSVRWGTGSCPTPAPWSCLSCSGLVFPFSPFPGWRSGPTLVLRLSLHESALLFTFPDRHRWVGLRGLSPPSSCSIRKEHVHSCPRAVPCYKAHALPPSPSCESLAHSPSRLHPPTSSPGRHGSRPSSSPGTH